jgi:hypothetical protein
MQDRRLPVEERIRLCVKRLTPEASPSELAQGLPVSEIRKYLSVLDNGEELTHLAQAMSTRKTMRTPIVLVKTPTNPKWQLSVITGTGYLPKDDGLRYRRIVANRIIIWNPVDDYGADLVKMP